MAKTATADKDLRKGAEVVARVPLRDVPEGTVGKVTMVTGISWIRYWVRFENGISLGSINRAKLATPEEWRRHLAGEDEPEAVDDEAGGEAEGAADDAGSGGGVTTPSGTLVPQKFIDRSKAARERLGA